MNGDVSVLPLEGEELVDGYATIFLPLNCFSERCNPITREMVKKKKKNHLIKGSRGVLSTVRRSALEESVEINNAFKTCFETCTKD